MPEDVAEKQSTQPIHACLQENVQIVSEMLGASADIVFREIRSGQEGQIVMGIIYVSGLVDIHYINKFVMEPVMLDIHKTNMEKMMSLGRNPLQVLEETVLTVGDIQHVTNFDMLFTRLLSGDVILLVDGYAYGFAIGSQGGEQRGVEEPSSETVVRGPKESFNEKIFTNVALIRRKIRDPKLWLELRRVGRVTRTNVGIMYIKGIVNDKMVTEVRARLDRIDIDSVLESGYIEELIQDETFTPFPTVYNSERPDVIASHLLQGKVAILVDGTPFVLVVPVTFASFVQSPEDYYNRADITSLVRIIRYISIMISLLAPSLFISILTFHQEMLPAELLVNLASQREGVPFPTFVEAILMEVTFEILREAAVRLPRAIGGTVSIVGTFVIGQAAVEAGIVSASMVIVVSVTAIASLAYPAVNLSIATRMLRFPFMVLAGAFGIFGILTGLIVLAQHLCSLRSFGVPYMAPFAPLIVKDQKDTIFRFPQWAMLSRPHLISSKNVIRQQTPSNKKSRHGRPEG